MGWRSVQRGVYGGVDGRTLAFPLAGPGRGAPVVCTSGKVAREPATLAAAPRVASDRRWRS